MNKISAFMLYHVVVIACYQAILKFQYGLKIDQDRLMYALGFLTLVLGISLALGLLNFMLDPKN